MTTNAKDTQSDNLYQRTFFSFESILNPANRQFLEDQGKENVTSDHLTKKLVLGARTYHFDVDGDPFVPEKSPIPSPKYSKAENVNAILEKAARRLSGGGELSPVSLKRAGLSPLASPDCTTAERGSVVSQRKCPPATRQALSINYHGGDLGADLGARTEEESLSLSGETSPSNVSSSLASTVIKITSAEGIEHSCCSSTSNHNGNSDYWRPQFTESAKETPFATTEFANQSKESQTEGTYFNELNYDLLTVAVTSSQMALEIYKNHLLKLALERREQIGLINCHPDDEPCIREANSLYNKIQKELSSIENFLGRRMSDVSIKLALQKLVVLNELLRKASNDLLRLRLRRPFNCSNHTSAETFESCN